MIIKKSVEVKIMVKLDKNGLTKPERSVILTK